MIYTHEHLEEQRAVSIPRELVPAVGEVVGQVLYDAWVSMFPTQHRQHGHKTWSDELYPAVCG